MFNSKLNVIMVHNSECMVIHNSMTRLIGLWTYQHIKFKIINDYYETVYVSAC